jgi:large subunit ribosomal protein L21
MSTFAVVLTGGKQYIVTGDQELVVDRINTDSNEIELQTVFAINDGKIADELKPIKAQIIEHVKGEKIRVAKFKSKVRFRRVNGFRPALTRIKIGAI